MARTKQFAVKSTAPSMKTKLASAAGGLKKTKNPKPLSKKHSQNSSIKSESQKEPVAIGSPKVKKAPMKPKVLGPIDKERIKRRWKAGTVALRDIRKYQNSTKLLVRKDPFQREIDQNVTSNEMSKDEMSKDEMSTCHD